MKASTNVISMRLSKDVDLRLRRLARIFGWSVSDASSRLVEEGLRRTEFAFIDFRNSPMGRQAYIQGSSLAVWEVVLISQDYTGDIKKTARHLHWPLAKVNAALNYAKEFKAEIDLAIKENKHVCFEDIAKMIPSVEEFVA